MRRTIHEIEPHPDDGTLEELAVAPARPGGSPVAAPGRADPVPIPSAAVLGPNGDVVMALLERAAIATPDQCRNLQRETEWRWGNFTPVAAQSIAAVRFRAVWLARQGGRADAVGVLQNCVVALAKRHAHGRSARLLAAGIEGAGLAVLTRDLLDGETFEFLFGPWRTVMHH